MYHKILSKLVNINPVLSCRELKHVCFENNICTVAQKLNVILDFIVHSISLVCFGRL